jgi:hypothetical protein
LPLYRHSNDRDFFFCGDDDELVTGAVTGASALEVFDSVFSRVSRRRGMSGGRSESWRASPLRRSLSSSAMPRAERGNGVAAVRSNDKVTVVAWEWEGNALRRARGCLSASGVTRSMHSSGVIVACVFYLTLWALPCSPITLITYDYLPYLWYRRYFSILGQLPRDRR